MNDKNVEKLFNQYASDGWSGDAAAIGLEEFKQFLQDHFNQIVLLRDAAEASSKKPGPVRMVYIGNVAAFDTVLEMMDGLPEEEKPPRKMAPSVPPPSKQCRHERLNEEGICRTCNADCRGMSL